MSVRGRDAPIHEEISAADEGAFGPYLKGPQCANLVWCARSLLRTSVDHALLAHTTRPINSSFASGEMMAP